MWLLSAPLPPKFSVWLVYGRVLRLQLELQVLRGDSGAQVRVDRLRDDLGLPGRRVITAVVFELRVDECILGWLCLVGIELIVCLTVRSLSIVL